MRGVAGSMTVPADQRCVRCRTRWKQHADGLCRSCHRAGQLTDPVHEAVLTLRRFIGRAYVFTPKDEAQRVEVYRQTGAAERALDLLVVRLRDVTAQEKSSAKTGKGDAA